MTKFFRALLAMVLLTISHAAFAQVVYGVGSTTVNGPYGQIFIVNPTTGLATTPTVPNSITGTIPESVALAVSPLNGLVYLVERAVATPRIVTWNPSTGQVVLIGNAGTPAGVGSFLRSTFCPDGRYYIAGNGAAGAAGAEIYQINPTNGALIRTIVISNLPTNGSGDVVCTSNGDLYIVAQNAAAPNLYQMYRATAAQVASGAGNITIAATLQGDSNIANTQAFNGLSEAPNGSLLASTAFNQTAVYSISTSTFAATTLTTTDFVGFVDLSRGFPIGIALSKTQTPASVIQGTQTITYSIVVNNAGPAVAGNVSITDALPSSFTNVNWVCAPTNPGLTTTVVTTACSTPSGTGNVNNTVSLSIGGQVRYTITALLSSTFTGTLTNVVNGTVSALLTVTTPSATISTSTATVQPAANLAITKTNGITTPTFVAAGSTITYTITVSNFGPGPVANAILRDAPGAGLNCAPVITCAVGSGAAVCPTAPISLSSLLAGVPIPSLGVNSSLTFSVTCGVTATGT